MFNNFVNGRDFYDLFHKAPAVLAGIGRGLSPSQQRVRSTWAHVDALPTNWWDIPAVRLRWNELISGSSEIDFHSHISNHWLHGRSNLNALSLGCGTGHNELAWAGLAKFKRIDGCDLSDKRIEVATAAALEAGLAEQIQFRVGDVFGIDSPDEHYDMIMVEQSLHHFSPLEKILLRINRFLKSDGHFVVNEFVGPTRFQWTARQLEVVNGILTALPDRYKTLWGSTTLKRPVVRPSQLRMILTDPSEAIESEQIVPLLRAIFNVVEFRGYGGSTLHLLFNGIAHNFLVDDSETAELLNLIFRMEDLLLRNHDIEHDFIVAVCKKRPIQ
jgi:ubiquinone/menaquinone biosynthesis C-methylase UbiE